MNSRKTRGVDSEALAAFLTELVRLMARTSINHEVSELTQCSWGFSDLWLVWPLAGKMHQIIWTLEK